MSQSQWKALDLEAAKGLSPFSTGLIAAHFDDGASALLNTRASSP